MTNPEQREKIARDEAIVECLRAIVWTEARTTYQDYWFAKGKEALVAYDDALAAIIALDPAPESAKPGWDIDGICNDHGVYLCQKCTLDTPPLVPDVTLRSFGMGLMNDMANALDAALAPHLGSMVRRVAGTKVNAAIATLARSSGS